MPNIIALGVAALIVSIAGAHADSLTLETPARSLDPSIQSVSMCGHWQFNGEAGSFRIIYGWLWGHTELYVQWVAAPVWYPEEGREERRLPRVVKTAVLPELDHYESATDLDHVRCARDKGRWTITADAENANDDGSGARYRLFVYLHDEPGKLTVKKRRVRPAKP